MSYILDALKKSEQAHGNRKTRRLFEEPLDIPVTPVQPSRSLRRWPYFIAIVLFLNIGFFVFWLGARRPDAHVKGPRPGIPGSQSTKARPQAPPIISPERPTRSHEKVKVAENQPEKKERSAINPTVAHAATATPAGRPVTGTQTRKTVHNPIAENKPPLEHRVAGESLKTGPGNRSSMPPAEAGRAERLAVTAAESRGPSAVRRAPLAEISTKKSRGPKPSHNPKAVVTGNSIKTAKVKAFRENPNAHIGQPMRPAARKEILSDIRGLAELGASSGRPAARVPRLRELAPQIREAIPDLSVSMLIYSKQPHDRFIYINGAKRREGDEISSGLKLEQITPDGAIFSFQGRRFYKGVLGD